MTSLENGEIIGEFDLCDYGLPTLKGYLFHQISNGGNFGDRYPKNREYLRIIGLDKDNRIIEHGYIYFMLFRNKDGIPISEFIGSKVFEEYRNKGLGDLLMSIYLFYSYEKGYTYVESTTRQRKLDLLSIMNKYGFRVKRPEIYDCGEKTTLIRNNMVVDIFKQTKGGIYYRFKTYKAERIYRTNNAKVAGNYNYLPPMEELSNPIDMNQIGWVVPNEEYRKTVDDNKIVDDNLKKSGFSK